MPFIPNDSILNEGLSLAMEFGPDWLKPIQERLASKHQMLSPDELDQYNKICRSAMKSGHEFVYEKLGSTMKEGKTITHENLKRELQTFLSKKYSWITPDNYAKLLSQSIYYAYKDGLHMALAT